MYFSSSTLTAVLGLSATIVTSGYTSIPSFTRGIASKTTSTAVSFSRSSSCSCCLGGSCRSGCNCPSCTKSCKAGCNCPSCTKTCRAGCKCPDCWSSTALMMSMEENTEAPAEEVPAEVVAMDGIASEEEAHNVERPKTSLQKRRTKPKGVALSELTEGSTVEGKIKTITSYGAFVDIGAATDALLHVSRLSDEFVSKVEDIVQVGQDVQVRIVKIDAEKRQVAVSMRSEEADQKEDQRGAGGKRRQRPQRSGGDRAAQMKLLGELNEKGFDTDKMIEGSVQSTLDFGAFVRIATADLVEGIEGEVDGLVHISQLSVGRVENVESIVKVGQKVQVRVKSVDSEGGKVSLSMITAEEDSQNTRKGGGNKQGKGFAGMYTDSEMGAKDWKEKLEKFSAEQPVFTNSAVIVERRK